MQAQSARVPFAVCFGAACAAIMTGLLVQHWPNTGRTLLDTDDAMRLVQMRDWLAGQGWFDLHQYRIAPEYESHWSRLVDAGLGAVLFVFSRFADGDFAERLLRAVWPLIWIVPTLASTVAIAWRIAGREAALVALLLAVAGVPAYQQFTPGRIDHHNVQIALTMLTLAAAVWSDRLRWCAAAAGAGTGMALAIGFESLPYLAACGAVFAIRYAASHDGAVQVRFYALSLASSVALALAVNAGPDRWMRILCDAIALNSTAAITAGAIVVVAGSLLRSEDIVARCMTVVLAGAAAAATLAAFEPRCLSGPYAMVDPAIWPVWLADVRENQPLLRVLGENPLTGAAIAAFPAAAAVAAAAMLREPELRRDFAFLSAVAVFLIAALTMMAAIRAYSYAMWLGMPLVAIAAVRMFAAFRLQTVVSRFAAAMLLTPLALSSGAITVAAAAGLDDTRSFARPESRHCLQSDAYRQLAQLPRGLVMADVSFGPFILALTPHSVVSGPYHRLSTGILASHRAFAAEPDAARAVIKKSGAQYLAFCGPRPPDGMSDSERQKSLWTKLVTGQTPDWLDPVPGMGGFSVYRIIPD